MSVIPTDAPLPVGKLPAGLLGRLLARDAPVDPTLLVGPGVGRDAAAIAIGGAVLVAKTDPITFATKDAATYLVDVNANDLACLGATPRWLLVTALLPEGTTAVDVDVQFAALNAASARRGIALVGGHTEITVGLDRAILVGQLLGETTPERLLRPGGSRPGDRLLLTKAVAIEGTALLATEREAHLVASLGADTVARAARLLHDPGISVVRDAEALLAAGGVHALHDPTEGGLAMAVRELASAAGCGAALDRAVVPLLPETAAIAALLGIDPLGMLASGCLLAAAPPAAVPALRDAGAAAGIAVTEIGRVTDAAEGFALRTEDGMAELPRFDTDEVSRALMAPPRSGIGDPRPRAARVVGSPKAWGTEGDHRP